MTMSFAGQSLGGAHAAFGGDMLPFCNYASPLAKKFIYQETTKVYYPLRRHVFRLKVRTAAEIRFNELVNKFMAAKKTGQHGAYATTITNNIDLDNMSSIIPKDEYEIRKLTSYMTSKKMSEDYRKQMNRIYQEILFVCESTNYAGQAEVASNQNSRPGTDEEFMALVWYTVFACTLFGFAFTMAFWWWKWGAAPEYQQVK
jgi:hypothetical protein